MYFKENKKLPVNKSAVTGVFIFKYDASESSEVRAKSKRDVLSAEKRNKLLNRYLFRNGFKCATYEKYKISVIYFIKFQKCLILFFLK